MKADVVLITEDVTADSCSASCSAACAAACLVSCLALCFGNVVLAVAIGAGATYLLYSQSEADIAS